MHNNLSNDFPNEKQSLEMIKQALDNAAQKGVYPNLETAYSISVAYNILHDAINKKNVLPVTQNQDEKH